MGTTFFCFFYCFYVFFFKKAFFNYIYCASEVIEAQVSFYEEIDKETGLPLTVVEIDNFQKNVKIGDIVKILLANSESYEIRTLEPEKMVVSFSGKRTILANNQLHELP